MEPANVNPEFDAPDDRELAARLRAAQPPLPDDGFSLRVLATLPPPRPARAAAPGRGLVCLIGGLLGAATAWPHLSARTTLADIQHRLGETFAQAREALPAATASGPGWALWLALGVVVLSLAYAFSPGLRRTLF